MSDVEHALREAIAMDPLPGGFRLVDLAVRHRPGEPTRVELRLAREGAPEATCALDASTSAEPSEAPFRSPPWHATYRRSTLPFDAFAPAAREVVARLARRFPTALPRDTRGALAPGAHAWFVHEAVLLDALRADTPEARERELGRALAAHAPGDAPLEVQLYLSGRCRQRCAFCTVPHESDEGLRRPAPPTPLVASGAFAALVRWLATRPGSALTLLGDDWSAHPEREAMFELLAHEPAVALRLFGPGTALADAALANRVAAMPSLARVTVTLEAAPDTPEGRAIHDAVVGSEGAASRLHAVVEARAGRMPLHVATVVHATSVDALPDLADYCLRHGLRLSVAGFVPDTTPAKTFRPEAHFAPIDRVRAALERAIARAPGVVERISGLPACAVPEAAASLCADAWASPDAEAWSRPSDGPCGGCGAAHRCSGVPAAYVRAHGTAGLVRLRT